MVNLLLNRKTDFYFWTGILVGMLNIANFGLAYTEVEYVQRLFPVVSALLIFLSGILALFYFRSQKKEDSKLESGCFRGVVTLIVLFNLGYNLLLIIAML